MKQISALIVFHSDYGNTEKMAQAVAAGMQATDVNVTVETKQAVEASPDDLLAAHVIVFGTPVHMLSLIHI